MVSSQERIVEAIGHHQAGRLEEAAAVYQAVLDEAPDNPDALHLFGVTRFRQGRSDDALGLIDRALLQAPAMSHAHYNRGNVLLALDRIGEAADAYRRAAGHAPDTALFWRELGNALMKMGEPGEATDAFAAACGLTPDDVRLWARLGEAAEAAGRVRAAEAAYRQVLILAPDITDAHRHYVDAADQVARADVVAETVAANRRRAEAGLRGPAPNIYLKGYSRPFYLDRMIHSIERLVTGYDRIIVINDGISPTYMERIREAHPRIEIRSSPKIEGGVFAAPASEAFLKRKKFFRTLDYLDPARFWWREIARDPNDYVVVIDEDCWFFEEVDLGRMVDDMRAEGCLSCALMYERDQARASRKVDFPPHRRGSIGPVAGVDYFRHDGLPRRWETGYQVFASTQSVVMKEYWLNNYAGVLHFTNEMHLNERAVNLYGDVVGRVPVSAGTADGGIVRHSMSSTSRSDAGGNRCLNKIDPDLYHDLVSELWFAGEFDCMADFPHDYSTERLVSLMRGRIEDAQIDAWMEWREEFVKMFYWLG